MRRHLLPVCLHNTLTRLVTHHKAIPSQILLLELPGSNRFYYRRSLKNYSISASGLLSQTRTSSISYNLYGSQWRIKRVRRGGTPSATCSCPRWGWATLVERGKKTQGRPEQQKLYLRHWWES